MKNPLTFVMDFAPCPASGYAWEHDIPSPKTIDDTLASILYDLSWDREKQAVRLRYNLVD